MINVLHILGSADFGGMSSVILNYYKHIDRQKIRFDIALTTDSFGIDGEVLKKLGANFYWITKKSVNREKYKKQLIQILRNKHYDVIHVHENETSFYALHIAKVMGVRIRIAHAHTSAPYVGFKQELRRIVGCFLNYHYSTTAIACGKLAAERVFGKWNSKKNKCVILPNSVEVEKYNFDKTMRNKIRESLNLEKKYVIGLVGRISREKNYQFAIELTKRLKKYIDNVTLLCIGDGEEMSAIKEMVKNNHVEESVILLGKKSDVRNYYNAFDVQIMPSLHEGFPVAAIEGLCSGLKILMSDTITKEFSACGNCIYLPLNDIDKWIAEILFIYRTEKRESDKHVYEWINSKFNIDKTKSLLEDIYMGIR